MTSTERILSLIDDALSNFEARSHEANIRSAVRIANLVGDTTTALRLSHELRGIGGDTIANKVDAQRLMPDPDSWSDPDGPAVKAIESFIKDRSVSDEKMMGHSIRQIEFIHQSLVDVDSGQVGLRGQREYLISKQQIEDILDRVSYRVFMALCGWERQLSFQGIHERIFSAQRVRVDRLLAQGAPHLVDMFNAAFRRLGEAAAGQPGVAVAEELSQAITSCRRIMKAVADHVHPVGTELQNESGVKLDDPAYRNRLKEFTKKAISSSSVSATIEAMIAGVYERFAALDKLANKGVHAELALEEAEWCALNAYLVCGEILRIHENGSASEATQT